MQRNPSPKLTGPTRASPCRKMLGAVGVSPEELSTSESAASVELPAAPSTAPPVEAEFSQPRPARPLFAHGQAPALPSPKQTATSGGTPRSRRKTSRAAFVSPATRLEAELMKATQRPSAEIEE